MELPVRAIDNWREVLLIALLASGPTTRPAPIARRASNCSLRRPASPRVCASWTTARVRAGQGTTARGARHGMDAYGSPEPAAAAAGSPTPRCAARRRRRSS